jgi:mRNA-degrading endonuclease YafQ of YafQ-DinJ toxin-antitoxin module
MIVLNWTSSYKKSFKKITNPILKDKIIAAMNLLQENPFNPKLKTHKAPAGRQLNDYLMTIE